MKRLRILFLRYGALVAACVLTLAGSAHGEQPHRGDRFLEGYVTAVLAREFPLDKVSVVEVRDGMVTLSAPALRGTELDRVTAVLTDVDGVAGVKVVDGENTVVTVSPPAPKPQEERTSLLPKGLLFAPLLADPRWPRFSVSYRYFIDDKELEHVGAANFGESVAIVRGPAFWDGHWEAGIQGGVFSIFDLASQSSDLINADYLIAFPATYRHGGLAFMTRLFHQSSHLGDEYLLRGDTNRVNLSYEAVDLKLSEQLSDTLRFYGGGGYLFHREPSDLEPWFTQAGLELKSPWTIFSNRLRPLAALDLQNHEENNWNADVSLRAGLQWESLRVVDRKIALMFEYYDGRNPNGQFYTRSLEYVGIGFYLTL